MARKRKAASPDDSIDFHSAIIRLTNSVSELTERMGSLQSTLDRVLKENVELRESMQKLKAGDPPANRQAGAGINQVSSILPFGCPPSSVFHKSLANDLKTIANCHT